MRGSGGLPSDDCCAVARSDARVLCRSRISGSSSPVARLAAIIAGREGCPRRLSMLVKPASLRVVVVTVELGIGTRNDRPGVRMSCRFAGEVSRVELVDGGVDVVQVEQYVGRDLVIGVDLDNADPVVGARTSRGRSNRHERGRGAPRGSRWRSTLCSGADLSPDLHIHDFGGSTGRMPAFTTVDVRRS